MFAILTTSSDSTADHLVRAALRLAAPFLRIDTDRCLEQIRLEASPNTVAMFYDNQWIHPSDLTGVWYRRPESLKVPGAIDSPATRLIATEWAEVLECFLSRVPIGRWMNHPALNVAANLKINQLRDAAKCGLITPDTIVTQSSATLRAFYAKHLGEVVVKPLHSGFVGDLSKAPEALIYTNLLSECYVDNLSDLDNCPTLFQQYIEKSFDARVTVVDDTLTSVALYADQENGLARCDIRRNNMANVRYESVQTPPDVAHKLIVLLRSYGLRFAAVDFAVSADGTWYFLEINPNGQWAWLDLAGVTEIAPLLVDALLNEPPSSKVCSG